MSAEDTPAPQPAQPDFSEHNVLAVLPDMEAARAAIADLEHQGIEGNAISLLGRAAEDATDPEEAGLERTRAADQEVTGQAARSAGKGAAIGAGAGGLAGFAAGAIAFGIPGVGPAVGAGIWAATIGGAAAGAGVGMTAGGIAGVKESEAWAVTYKAVQDAKAVVGVHSRDRELVDRAAEVLRGHDPERIEEFDVEGARRL